MSSLVFADAETISLLDLTKVGAYKYNQHPTTDNLVWTWAFDDEPYGHIWSPHWCWGNTEHSTPDKDPEELLDFINEGGYFVAWNAAFDRWHWNAVMVPKYGWPELKRDQVLCAQAQAEGNNLPGQLSKAAECLGTQYKKDPKGKMLINKLCHGTREAWDSEAYETPGNMGHFRRYGLHDTLAMRDVWNATRPLTLQEWAEYHASEAINDRGVAVDVEFALAAQQYALAESNDINERMAALTGDPLITITNHPRKARYLHEQLEPYDDELRELAEKPTKKKGDPVRMSCDRPTREAVLDLLAQPEHAGRFPDGGDHIIQFLELIEAGNSAAIRKFTAIVNQEVRGRVFGGYSFNGAGQTGRFSSRGIQVHNIIRDPVKKKDPNRAMDAVEDILDGRSPEYLQQEYGYSISRLLARLIRPTFIAPEGKMLIWSDWAQIEARVLPWLANTPGAERKLDLFRQGEDVYKHAALPIFNLVDLDQVDDNQRQVGKVSELALGFGGSVGAFSAMGRAYGITLPEDDVRDIVYAWRGANAWCVDFWSKLWEAAIAAYRSPMIWFPAGRVKYLFHPDLMHGTLICALPCGRWIVYPQFRHEYKWVKDKHDPDAEPRKRWVTSFVKGFGGGYGRVDIWYGTLAENITQGTSASFLRMAVVDLQDFIVLHTHDEAVLEVDIDQVEYMKQEVRDSMLYLPDWAEGLPLEVDIESGPFYTK